MNVLIVEDEEVVSRRLARLTRAILGPRLAALETAATIEAALARLRAGPLDLVFLDLDLEGRDGFAILREAVAGAFQTIIVSAHADRAIVAFEHGVTDFVAKPYSEDRLRQALARVDARGRDPGVSAAAGQRGSIDARGRDPGVSAAAGQRGSIDAREPALREHLRVLAVRRHGEVRLIPIDALVRVSAADDYAELHCEDGASWLHDKTLASLAHLLPARFERVHRSHLVDVRRIVRWQVHEGTRYVLVLDRGDEVPASRTWVQAFRRRIAD